MFSSADICKRLEFLVFTDKDKKKVGLVSKFTYSYECVCMQTVTCQWFLSDKILGPIFDKIVDLNVSRQCRSM